ncbi:MAG TPA: NCS2 family permease [Bacillota bacterium]|nr:NCS2 family permease [Bacillota bacterium]HPF42916.1 NCS2 family permease [Bacillota bacterium]HPJ86395.1 NCS2 family permease [Bacillota bacterium]HPQ62418.1 NCS2 family permease [Bacillota bacterium]HRX92160.1 NCS2 family permease [Candidatus Izemoplasmatales bacterium]
MKSFALKLKKYFKIDERGSSIGNELLGGLTIFLAMVYILPVNSSILSATGMSTGAVFAATALAAAAATLMMGLFANYPIGLASGMGVNAFFTYTIVIGLNYSWQEALAAVLVSGILFLTISLTGLRKKVINAIPKNLKIAVGAGIGFFIAFIGLKDAGIIVGSAATLVTFGELNHPTILLALFGIILVFVLHSLHTKISRFAVIISIVVTGLLGILIGIIYPPFASMMPSFSNASLGSISDIKYTFGQAFLALPDLLSNPMSYAVIFSLLFVDFFDTAGTLMAVGHDAGLITKEGELIDGDKALISDATGTIVGAIFGTSNVTSYIESTTGIKQGARTGLSATVVGILFIVSLLFYPIFSFVGSIGVTLSDGTTMIFVSPATSMALVYVGALMASQLKEIDWSDAVASVTAFIVIIMMILSYSISEGIAFGFMFYVILMLASKRGKEVNSVMYVLAGLFVVYYVLKFTVLM